MYTTLKKRQLDKILMLILSTCLVWSTPCLAQAQTPDFSLEVSPPTAYIHLEPGKVFDHEVTLTNTSAFTLAVTPQLTDFEPQEDGSVKLKNTATYPESRVQIRTEGVAFSQAFMLKPGEVKPIQVRFVSPFNATEDEHRLTLLFTASQSLPGLSVAQSGTAISGAVASNVVLFVSKQAANQGRLQIAQLKAPQVIDSFASLPFSLLLQNSGINATQVVGKVTVANRSNPTLKEYILYPDMVLANSKRQARGTTQAELDASLLALESDRAKNASSTEAAGESAEEIDYTKLKNLTSDFYYEAPILFGLYTVTASLGDQSHSVTVFALPVSLLLALLAIVVMGVSYWLLRRSWQLKKSSFK